MKRISIILTIIIAVVAFKACKHDPLVEEGPTAEENPFIPPVVIADTCDPDSVYFRNTIQLLIQSNCAFSGCHGNGSTQNGVDLSSYSSILATADIRVNDPTGSDLYEVLVEADPAKRMPPPPRNPLDSADIQAILNWISQGAKNNGCDDCDTSNFSFSANIQPIIQKNCEGCHRGSNPSGGIALTNYTEIQQRALNGQLFGAINHEPGYFPMPKNQAKLEQCKIDQIKNWIDNGAPND